MDNMSRILEKQLQTFNNIMKDMINLSSNNSMENPLHNSLTFKQIKYLETIYQEPNPTFSSVAAALKLSKPSVTAIMNKFIESGYVYKQQNEEDKRIFHVYLTDRGRELIEGKNKAYKHLAKHIYDSLNISERITLERLFDRILNSFNNGKTTKHSQELN